MRLHLLAPWTGALCEANTADAQVGIARTFATMMQRHGAHVIEYGVAGSDTEAAERVTVAEVGAAVMSREFDEALTAAVMMRARPGDIVCHSIGGAHQQLVSATLGVLRHVEHAVSYDRAPTDGVHRVYASEAWRNWMWGRYHGHTISDHHRGEVIPHAVDPGEWTAAESHGYALFLGRLTPTKYGNLPEIIAATPAVSWRLVGPGDDSPFRGFRNVQATGTFTGAARARMVSEAAVLVSPTPFCEPFGLAAIEAGMCGVPVVVPRAGAYLETISSRNGFMVDDMSTSTWADAIGRAIRSTADRRAVRDHYATRFSPQAVGARYRAFFERITGLGR